MQCNVVYIVYIKFQVACSKLSVDYLNTWKNNFFKSSIKFLYYIMIYIQNKAL